tara:strand:+ start:337 stop:1050 length:714 start_codon:yes stop_codon:yes gene_type:complete
MIKKKLKLSYWLRKVFVTKLFQYLPIKKSKLRKLVFTSIYKSAHWNQGENKLSKEHISISGHGSNLNTKQFYNLISNFTNALNIYEIKSILDMPCGDALWIKEIFKKKDINYLGVDIVEDLINSNKELYENDNIKFINSDIIDFSTEKKFDLVFMRDFFIHIDNSDIKKVINNLKKMNIKYFAFTNYETESNVDVTTGKHRKINMQLEPFKLGSPIYSFNDYEKDKFIHFYEKSALK